MLRKGSRMKKILGNLLFLAMGIVIGLVLFIRGPVGILRVTSGSMEPALEVGDICIVDKRADFSGLKVGEMVVFYYGNDNKACHRIVEKSGSGFITKGDANENPDVFLLTKDNYYGRVAFSI